MKSVNPVPLAPKSKPYPNPSTPAQPKSQPGQKPNPHTPGVPAQHPNVPTYPQTDAPVYTPDQVPGSGVPTQTPPAKP
jgi:hypothetical protein